jgi:SAM-dependent methyltransferase
MAEALGRVHGAGSAAAHWCELVLRRDEQLAARERATGIDARGAANRTYARRLQETVKPGAPEGLLWSLLFERVGPRTTVVDVGCGPGRYTLPLAKRAASVVAVEPSAQMVGYLQQNLAAAGIANVAVVERSWQEADVPTADVVLCSHVLYDVPDAVAFLAKLDACAAGVCFVVHHIGQYDPLFRFLWQRIYREERLPLPVFADLMAVLGEMGIEPAGREQMPPTIRLSFATLAEAVDYCTERLALVYDGRNRDLVGNHLVEILEPIDGRLYAPPSPPTGVVWWNK